MRRNIPDAIAILHQNKTPLAAFDWRKEAWMKRYLDYGIDGIDPFCIY
jgi:hypothetical protein